MTIDRPAGFDQVADRPDTSRSNTVRQRKKFNAMQIHSTPSNKARFFLISDSINVLLSIWQLILWIKLCLFYQKIKEEPFFIRAKNDSELQESMLVFITNAQALGCIAVIHRSISSATASCHPPGCNMHSSIDGK